MPDAEKIQASEAHGLFALGSGAEDGHSAAKDLQKRACLPAGPIHMAALVVVVIVIAYHAVLQRTSLPVERA
jgi:hypothetical protein